MHSLSTSTNLTDDSLGFLNQKKASEITKNEVRTKLEKNNVGYVYNFFNEDVESLLPGRLYTSSLLSPSEETSNKNTLSARYGLNSFPFHSDGVTEDIPPRFISLKFLGAKSANVEFKLIDLTKIIDDKNLDYFKDRALFNVANGGGNSFISQMFEKISNTYFIKYNPAIMSPINKDAVTLFKIVNSLIANSTEVIFRPPENSTVIFDNHRFVHSRGPVSLDCVGLRRVERTWIYT